MLAVAATLRLEFADALVDLVAALGPARLVQSLGKLGQPGLKVLAEAINHRRLLGLAQFGVAVQQHLPGVLARHLLQPQRLPPCRLDGHRVVRIELALPAAAHHPVAIAVVCQPVQVVLGGDARIHDDHRARVRLKVLEHGLQRDSFGDVAREGLAAPKPLPSSTRPSVIKAQSLLFSSERPRLALALPASSPSK